MYLCICKYMYIRRHRHTHTHIHTRTQYVYCIIHTYCVGLVSIKYICTHTPIIQIDVYSYMRIRIQNISTHQTYRNLWHILWVLFVIEKSGDFAVVAIVPAVQNTHTCTNIFLFGSLSLFRHLIFIFCLPFIFFFLPSSIFIVLRSLSLIFCCSED